jgi:hypothetical protein
MTDCEPPVKVGRVTASNILAGKASIAETVSQPQPRTSPFSFMVWRGPTSGHQANSLAEQPYVWDSTGLHPTLC